MNIRSVLYKDNGDINGFVEAWGVLSSRLQVDGGGTGLDTSGWEHKAYHIYIWGSLLGGINLAKSYSSVGIA